MYFRGTTLSQIFQARTNHFNDLRPTPRSQVSKISLAGEANKLLAPMCSTSRPTADIYRREQARPLPPSLMMDFHAPNILRASRYYCRIRHREQSEATQTRVVCCGLVWIASLCSQ